MSLLATAIPPQVRLALAGLVVAIVLGLGLALYVSHLHNTDLAHQLAAENLRADELGAKVVQADQAVAEAKAVNARMAQALQAMSAANAAASAENAKLEAAANHAASAVARAAAAARDDDLKRRARPDLPTPNEMTDVMRGVLESM